MMRRVTLVPGLLLQMMIVSSSILVVAMFAGCFLRPSSYLPAYLSSGSMAESFWGPCFQLRCDDCGFPFRCDAERKEFIPVDRRAVCPNCGYRHNQLTRDKQRHGQQVWYDASSFHQRPPVRWQVVAFRSPDDKQTARVKRIVGLPGEWIAIRGGDVYADERLLRKSLDQQRRVAVLVHDATYQATGQGNQRWHTVSDDSGWRRSDSGFSFTPAVDRRGELEWLEYRNRPAVPLPPGVPPAAEAPINDNYGYNQGISRDLNDVRDVMLSCWMRLVGSGQLVLSVTDGSDRIDVVFSTAEHRISVHSANGNFVLRDPNPSLSSLRRVEVSVFDRQFVLAFDGRTMVRFELPPRPSQPPDSRPFRIGGKDLHALVSELKVWRDTYYLNPRGLASAWRSPQRLGATEYFVLGDNPPISADSRNWEKPGVGRKLLLGPVFRASH